MYRCLAILHMPKWVYIFAPGYRAKIFMAPNHWYQITGEMVLSGYHFTGLKLLVTVIRYLWRSGTPALYIALSMDVRVNHAALI